MILTSVLEAKNIDNLQLLIQFAQTKINNDNKIVDKKTLEDVKQALSNFIIALKEPIEKAAT